MIAGSGEFWRRDAAGRGAVRPSLAAANAWCRNYARRHAENFTVASWLLPSSLRQPFANVYAWCRWADDLADAGDNVAQNLQRLDDWWSGIPRAGTRTSRFAALASG